MTHIPSLISFFLLVVGAGASGALFGPGAWYESLKKPSWTPPGWAFPVVWTILYAMIAVAGWLVWRRAGIGPALVAWGIGLAINALWSYVMFGRHAIGLAMVDVSLLWLATAAFILLAWNVDRIAASLFLPYLAWVSVAASPSWK